MHHELATKPQSLLEIALLVYGTALAIAVVIVMTSTRLEDRHWLLVGGPLLASALAVVSRSRPIVWTALGACLAIGILALFSIGLLMLQIGICVFLWWLISCRRAGRPVMVWSDLIWETIAFLAVMTPFAI